MRLPGFRLTLGFTLTYTSLIVLIPLSLLVWNTMNLSWADFVNTVTNPRVVASYRLTFGTAFCAACVNGVFGFLLAWTLVRYKFFGKYIIDALVDIPFAMPTAVSGIALVTICASTGWVGFYAQKYGIAFINWAEWCHLDIINVPWLDKKDGLKLAYSPIGIFIALTFIGFPFVVRTLQPALQELDKEVEEAAESLGASKFQTFWCIIFPTCLPALLTGFTLAFARALGEYGSVVFIAGNIAYETEITSLLIYMRLEEVEYPKATAISVVMLTASFLSMLTINIIQWRTTRQ